MPSLTILADAGALGCQVTGLPASRSPGAVRFTWVLLPVMVPSSPTVLCSTRGVSNCVKLYLAPDEILAGCSCPDVAALRASQIRKGERRRAETASCSTLNRVLESEGADKADVVAPLLSCLFVDARRLSAFLYHYATTGSGRDVLPASRGHLSILGAG